MGLLPKLNTLVHTKKNASELKPLQFASGKDFLPCRTIPVVSVLGVTEQHGITIDRYEYCCTRTGT